MSKAPIQSHPYLVEHSTSSPTAHPRSSSTHLASVAATPGRRSASPRCRPKAPSRSTRRSALRPSADERPGRASMGSRRGSDARSRSRPRARAMDLTTRDLRISTRAVRAGLPAGSQGEPFLPGPVFAAPFHLVGDPAGSPYVYGRYGNPTWTLFENAVAVRPSRLEHERVRDDHAKRSTVRASARSLGRYLAAAVRALDRAPRVRHGQSRTRRARHVSSCDPPTRYRQAQRGLPSLPLVFSSTSWPCCISHHSSPAERARQQATHRNLLRPCRRTVGCAAEHDELR